MKKYTYINISERDAFEQGRGDRFCFAFVLYVNRRAKSVLCSGWWASDDETMNYKIGMQVTAAAFQKSARIAVYVKAKQINNETGEAAEVWKLYGGNAADSNYYVAPTCTDEELHNIGK